MKEVIVYIVAPYKQIAVIYLTSNELVKRDLEVFNKSNYKFKHVAVTNEVTSDYHSL